LPENRWIAVRAHTDDDGEPLDGDELDEQLLVLLLLEPGL
jgi:hypothetical protein